MKRPNGQEVERADPRRQGLAADALIAAVAGSALLIAALIGPMLL